MIHTKLHTIFYQLSKRCSTTLYRLIFLVCITSGIPNSLSGQEVEVIDKKGTIVSVSNNTVTANTLAPINPVEGDIWFNTTNATNPSTFVWDGAAWQEITHKGTAGSIFFAGTNGSPTEDNNQIFWDDTNNRLGVGTNSPTNKLQVAGATRTQGVLNSNGTENEPSYRFNDDTNTGIFRPAADELGFSVGGIEAMNIDETSGEAKVIVNETLELEGQVLDENNSPGTVGHRISPGATVARLSRGYYRITLAAGLVSDEHYIIQVSQLGRGGAGNDDPGISYNNQTANFFDVIVGDNDNGGNDRARYDGEFTFTILDL